MIRPLPVLVNSSVKEFGKVLIVIPENKRDVGLAGFKKLDRNIIQLLNGPISPMQMSGYTLYLVLLVMDSIQ